MPVSISQQDSGRQISSQALAEHAWGESFPNLWYLTLFFIGAFMFAAGKLHDSYHWHELHRQLDELLYNLARPEATGTGEHEQGG